MTDLLSRLRAIGEKAMAARIDPLLHVEAQRTFDVALRNAWPSLCARIEAGERLAEALKNVATSYAAFGESCWCDGVSGEHEGHDSDCIEARAALAAFRRAKEEA